MQPSVRAALLAAILGAVASGCSEKPKPTVNTKSAPTASASATPIIEATWRGAPLSFVSALSFSRGGRALHLTLSTHEITCAHLREPVQMLEDEVSVDLTIAPLLRSDGSELWAISRVRFGKVTREGKLGTATIDTQSPLEDLHADLDLKASFPPDQLVLKGKVATTACGVLPWASDAQLREQRDLQLELSGKRIVVRGASLEEGGRKLVLSSEPHVCGTTLGSDLALDLTLSPQGEVEALHAEGYILPAILAVKLSGSAEAPLRASFGLADATTKVTLDGQLTVGGYRLSVSGSVDAERCADLP